MGGGDGVGPGPNALKSQVIGFLFAAAYMRGTARVLQQMSCLQSTFRVGADAHVLCLQCRS